MFRPFSLAAFALVLGTLGCAAKATSPTTLTGSAALSTFPTPPEQVQVTDEAGRSIVAPIGGSGLFTVALARGHRYSVVFVTTSGDVALAFPRKTGRLDSSFVINSDGARVNLGSVHFTGGTPTGGFHIMASSSAPVAPGDIADDQVAQCDDGAEGGDSSDVPDDSAQVDSTSDMAVAEHNAPTQVDGCENDGEQQDDGEQQGEH